jgi:chemotaxis response regulator CheB
MTIAQDKESCVVYGMPRAAVELNAAEKILPLPLIAAALLAAAGYLENASKGSTPC